MLLRFLLLHLLLCLPAFAQVPLRLATFDVDATPPLGAPMAYDTVKRLDEMTLRCRGVVLLGAGDPLVLCAVDWIGIANEGHDAFRAALAEASTLAGDDAALGAALTTARNTIAALDGADPGVGPALGRGDTAAARTTAPAGVPWVSSERSSKPNDATCARSKATVDPATTNAVTPAANASAARSARQARSSA